MMIAMRREDIRRLDSLRHEPRLCETRMRGHERADANRWVQAKQNCREINTGVDNEISCGYSSSFENAALFWF